MDDLGPHVGPQRRLATIAGMLGSRCFMPETTVEGLCVLVSYLTHIFGYPQ